MPQEFQVLRCFSCEKFQVHPIKKAKKWRCKVCGENQSLKQAYSIGTARDCRLIVQKCNFEAGKRKQAQLYQENCTSETIEEYCLPESENFDKLLDEFELESCENVDSFSTFYGPSIENIPRKKQRCDSHSECETSFEHSGFNYVINDYEGLHDVDQDLVLGEMEPTEDKCKLNINKDIRLESDTETYLVKEKNVNSVSKDKTELNSAIPFDDIGLNPHVMKNRGFQMILKAAEKLS